MTLVIPRTKAVKSHMRLGHTPISYSSLKKLREGGIHNYYRYKERELEPDTSPSLSLGTLIDEYFLNREEFDDKYILDDTEGPSSPNQQEFCRLVNEGVDIDEAYKRSYKNPPKTSSILYKKAVELYEDNEDFIKLLPKLASKQGYSNDDSFILSQIKMNFLGHKVLSQIMGYIDDAPEHIEVKTHFKLKGLFSDLPVRGEIDLLIIDHEQQLISHFDLKSTNYHLCNFLWEVNKRDYAMQAVLYDQILLDIISRSDKYKNYEVTQPSIISARTTGSYDVAIFQLPEEWYNQEVRKLRDDFALLTWHYENNKFKYPKEYYEGNGIIELPFVEDRDLWKERIEQSLA